MKDRYASTSPRGERKSVLIQYLAIGIFGYILGTLSGTSQPSVVNLATGRRLEETSHEGKTEEKTGEHESLSEGVNVATVTCIVILLIVLTIIFEFSKENLEERATRNLRPLVDKLFGEMTVLGFLSVVTFCITKAGWFTILSEELFGEENELLEIFEFVHFTIFFIMISFVLQVLVLVAAAMETEQDWVEMDQAARDSDDSSANQKLEEDWERNGAELLQPGQTAGGTNASRTWRYFFGLLPCFCNKKAQRSEDLVLFRALRNEFLLERSSQYPFHPEPEDNRVGNDFNFGRYLGINQGTLLAHVVEVSVTTWTFFGFLTGMHYLYVMAIHEDTTILAWTWVAMGWIVYAFNIYFERHLIQVRRMFLSKELFLYTKVGSTSENDDPLETTYLNTSVGKDHVHNEALPQWTDIDIDDYHQSRSWLARVLTGGGEISRQHAIYWLDRRGTWLYLHILQANLLFLGIYAAMNFLSFFRYIYTSNVENNKSILVFVIYIVLAGFPFLSILLTKQHTVAILSQICSMGAHRRPNVVDRVLREDKTARAVGTFLVLMRASSNSVEQRQQGETVVRTLGVAERQEVSKAFDALDHEGCGTIPREEFARLLQNLGSAVSGDALTQLVKRLDEDGSGGVSREEFIQWYAASAGDDNLTEKERAYLLFRLFDSDNTGEITIAEFKHKLDSLNVGFTVDEIGRIVNEMDEDNSGTIGKHEFANLLHKYHPKALRSLS